MTVEHKSNCRAHKLQRTVLIVPPAQTSGKAIKVELRAYPCMSQHVAVRE